LCVFVRENLPALRATPGVYTVPRPRVLPCIATGACIDSGGRPSEHLPTTASHAPGLRRVMGFGDVVLYFITAGINLQGT
jgi:hypothetical protein